MIRFCPVIRIFVCSVFVQRRFSGFLDMFSLNNKLLTFLLKHRTDSLSRT